jgi:hypothetical protein
MKPDRIKAYFLGFLVIAILSFASIELIRFLIVFQKVDLAVRVGYRTAISGAYKPEYCVAPCRYYSAEEDAATLKTVQETIKQSLDEIPFHSNNAGENWRSIICSDRKGYSYDEKTLRCIPEDDAGEDGGQVLVEVIYQYPLGSSLALHLCSIPIQVQKRGTNECFKVGCVSQLSILFYGNKPEEYTVEVTDENGQQKIVECTAGKMDAECTNQGVTFSSAGNPNAFTPTEMSIVIKWSAGSKTVHAKPEYSIHRPNGPRCTPECWNANVEVYLP